MGHVDRIHRSAISSHTQTASLAVHRAISFAVARETGFADHRDSPFGKTAGSLSEGNTAGRGRGGYTVASLHVPDQKLSYFTAPPRKGAGQSNVVCGTSKLIAGVWICA